jgi:hypothetical protein
VREDFCRKSNPSSRGNHHAGMSDSELQTRGAGTVAPPRSGEWGSPSSLPAPVPTNPARPRRSHPTCRAGPWPSAARDEWGAGGPPDRPPIATNPVRVPLESSRAADTADVVRGRMPEAQR